MGGIHAASRFFRSCRFLPPSCVLGQIMGAETATITIAGTLQRFTEIQSPGEYLQCLTRKSEQGQFSPGPMIMALLNRDMGHLKKVVS